MPKLPTSSSTWRWRRSERASRRCRLIPEDLFLEFEVTQSTAAEGRFRRAIRRTIAPRIVLGFSPLAATDATALEAADPGGDPGDASRSRGPHRIEGRRTWGREPSASLASSPRTWPDSTRRSSGPWARASRAIPIVAAVAACASEIGARVIAPGVTSPEQLHELRNLGVELVQGPIVERTHPARRARDEPTDVGRQRGSSYRGPKPITTRITFLRRAPRPREVVPRETVDPSTHPRRPGDARPRSTGQPFAIAACPLLDVDCQAR